MNASTKIINEVVQNHWSEFEFLDIIVKDFVTDSIRKGASTVISTGSTVSTSMSSICLHKNWTLIGVKDRYIKYKKSGDQFVGRSVTGLPILEKYFAISPPCFFISSCQNDCEKVKKGSI